MNRPMMKMISPIAARNSEIVLSIGGDGRSIPTITSSRERACASWVLTGSSAVEYYRSSLLSSRCGNRFLTCRLTAARADSLALLEQHRLAERCVDCRTAPAHSVPASSVLELCHP